HLDRGHRVEATVHLDQDFDFRPHGIAHRLDQRHDLDLFGAVDLIKPCAKRVKFKRPVPAFDDPARRGMELFWAALDGVPAVGIGFDLVAHRAAQQPVDGLAQRLPYDVPTSDLDQGDAGHDHLAGAAIVFEIHAMDQLLDVEGVAAQHITGGRLLEIADHRIGPDE